jgi:hypothetical protein
VQQSFRLSAERLQFVNLAPGEALVRRDPPHGAVESLLGLRRVVELRVAPAQQEQVEGTGLIGESKARPRLSR